MKIHHLQRFFHRAAFGLLFIIYSQHYAGFAQGTSFFYQGRLVESGVVANGEYDLTFSLFSLAVGGASVGESIVVNNLGITNGLFSVSLDFGGTAFDGSSRWLEISVRPGLSNGAFIPLIPRQPITATPYAILAGGITGPVSAGQLTGSFPASQLSGTIAESRLSSNMARLNLLNPAAQAMATPVIVSGFIVGVNMISGGSDYVTQPAVTVNDPSGSGAIIIAQVSGGVVTNLAVSNAGSGYSAGATITIAPPPSHAQQIFSGPNLFPHPSNQFVGTFSGNGAGLTDLNGANLLAGSVTSAKLANNSITATLLAPGAAAANLNANGQSGVASGGVILSPSEHNVALANSGYVKLGTTILSDNAQALAVANIAARHEHSAIWTGTEMIVWGGRGGSGSTFYNDGGRFNPTADTWTLIPNNLPNCPAPRSTFTMVWTGTEMIIWGGQGSSTIMGDGGRYNPDRNSWIPLPSAMSNSPSARIFHTAVWTGTEMIVWGGFDGFSTLNNGARYHPGSNTWTSIPSDLPGTPLDRRYHTVVWTGGEMIIWGGASSDGSGHRDGGRYNPTANTWTAVPFSSTRRTFHSAVWTGTEMLVWGGVYLGFYPDYGSRYDPISNVWGSDFAMLANAPSPRQNHASIWTGREMIVWGGFNGTPTYFNNGASFNPAANLWTTLPNTLPATPTPRAGHTAVWTGGQVIIWGGYDGAGPIDFLDTWAYSPAKIMTLFQRP